MKHLKVKLLSYKLIKALFSNPHQLAQAVQFLHELGSLQHFNNPALRHHVVIDPQWIVDVMACVVSVKHSPIKVDAFCCCFSYLHFNSIIADLLHFLRHTSTMFV